MEYSYPKQIKFVGQSIFGLPATGVIDFATWNKISHIYVGITRLAELS